MLAIWIQKKRYKTTLFLFILLMIFCSTSVYGDSRQSACLDQTDSNWTSVEQWAWNSICTSDDNTADLDDYINEKWRNDKYYQPATIKKEMDSESYEDTKTSLQLCKIHIAKLDRTDDVIDKNVLDPDSDGWKERELSSRFLRDILLDDSRVSNIRSFGITIRNANFKGKIRLQNARINFPLRLESSLFDARVILNYINVKDVLSFDNSYFKQKFSMKSATITGDLSMRMGYFNSVLLTNTNIRNNLDISGAKTNGPDGQKKLEMDSITVGDDVVMCGVTKFNEVDLEAAHIGGTLYMTGTKVTDSLEMDLISIDHDLLMRYGAEFHDVDLAAAHIGANLDLTDAKITDELDMDSISIGGNLLMRPLHPCGKYDVPCSKLRTSLGTFLGTSEFVDVDLSGARIGGRMSLTGTTLKGELNMDSVFIREDLLMRNATFKRDVTLTNADIGDELSMSCSVFESLLNMNSINIGTNLYMNSDEVKRKLEGRKEGDCKLGKIYCCTGEAKFKDVTLKNATIGHHMEIIGAADLSDTSGGLNLNINSSDIGGSLKLMESSFETIALKYIRIGQNLDLEDAKITSQIDLTGAFIQNRLQLNPKEWGENKVLMLNNASANNFLMPVNWPEKVDISGFNYQKIDNEINKVLLDGVLQRFNTTNYTPQPYVHFANVLRSMGYNNRATEVIIAKMDHKRDSAEGMVTPIKLYLLKIFIGYGYAYFYSLGWALILVMSGFLMLRLERSKADVEDKKSEGILEQVFYSIDMLIPIIHLNKKHDEIKHGILFVRYYFYFHKVMGYVLTMAIVAGLSGMLAPEGF